MNILRSEFHNRVERFQEVLRREGIEGVLLVQRADTFYFSGTAQNVHVYIPGAGHPVVLAYRDVGRAREESAWDVIPLTGISKIPDLIEGAGLPVPQVIGMELDVLPVSNFERYRKAFPEGKFADVSFFVRMVRAVKSAWELAQIEASGQVYQGLLDYAKQVIRSGRTEIELEIMLESEARRLGHQGLVRVRGFGSEFYCSGLISGARGAVPGYFDGPVIGIGTSPAYPKGASSATIQAGEPVLVDWVTMVDGYNIDQTRTLVVGEVSPELRNAYETAVEVEERVRRALVPGRVTGEIYAEILAWVRENTPYEHNFMGIGATRVSFVGHGIGLELDELPTISRGAKEVLAAGMVISVEPKFVFAGVGAVGIEDTMVVEGNTGARMLCNAPRDLIVL